jgi:ribosomal protein L11 methyltransferase
MRALVVTVDRTDFDVASDALWQLGVLAVEERTDERGHVELWTSIGETADPPAGWPFAWRFVHVPDEVVDTWRAFAQPIEAIGGPNRIVVAPAWYDGAIGPGTVVRIEPGSTFGLGDHPTTRLCIRAIQRCVTAGDSVIDVGSGSGVLGITSRMLGAASAWCTDIAAEAVAVGEANARRNGVDRITFTTKPIQAGHTADVVVANILAPALIELAGQLVEATARTLVVSGLLDGRFDHVVAALSPLEMAHVERLDGWVAVELQRPAATNA